MKSHELLNSIGLDHPSPWMIPLPEVNITLIAYNSGFSRSYDVIDSVTSRVSDRIFAITENEAAYLRTVLCEGRVNLRREVVEITGRVVVMSHDGNIRNDLTV